MAHHHSGDLGNGPALIEQPDALGTLPRVLGQITTGQQRVQVTALLIGQHDSEDPRHGEDYGDSAPAAEVWEAADGDGEDVSTSRYPLLYVPDSWAVRSMLELRTPGIEHRIQRGDNGGRTVWMAHPDGCWARARTDGPRQSPAVHQGGPRRLWGTLEAIRDRLNTWGELPVYGSQVTITPDGQTTLSQGRWSATL